MFSRKKILTLLLSLMIVSVVPTRPVQAEEYNMQQGDILVDFEDFEDHKPSGWWTESISYGGVLWQTTGNAQWFPSFEPGQFEITEDGTAVTEDGSEVTDDMKNIIIYINHLWVWTKVPPETSFVLPEGMVLKSFKVRTEPASIKEGEGDDAVTTNVDISGANTLTMSTDAENLELINIGNEWQTVVTGWETATQNVTIKMDYDGPGWCMIFDDFVYGPPGVAVPPEMTGVKLGYTSFRDTEVTGGTGAFAVSVEVPDDKTPVDINNIGFAIDNVFDPAFLTVKTQLNQEEPVDRGEMYKAAPGLFMPLNEEMEPFYAVAGQETKCSLLIYGGSELVGSFEISVSIAEPEPEATETFTEAPSANDGFSFASIWWVIPVVVVIAAVIVVLLMRKKKQ